MIRPRRPHCYRRLAAAVKPRERLSVSAWADRHRVISSKQSGMPGRWRTAVNPVLREIMDTLSLNSPVHEVVIKKGNQAGVTEAMINALGYTMHHAPGPAMVLMPTLADRDTWKTQKLNPLLLETPAVRELLGGLRSRDAANRADMLDFPGGILFLAGGNSPNSYAQKSARLVMLDDLDRFPGVIGREGDPVRLAKGRCKAFPHKYKLLLASTPTVEGASLIAREYDDSDQRRYHVACPHCGHLQVLEWDNVRWDKAAAVPTSAWYECTGCNKAIDETSKPALLAGGRWIAARPGVARRGYHLNALTAPIGLGPSWLDLAREWVGMHRAADGKARRAEPALLQTFRNLHLGLTWEDRTTATKPHHLAQRADDATLGQIPPGVLALTVGIDTQDTWLEATLLGWFPWQDDGAPGWRPVDWVQFPGDTARPEVWNELEAWLNAPRVNAYGKPIALAAAGIDNRGHRAEQVRAFTLRHSLKIPVYRVQGSTTRQAAIIASTAREAEKDHKGRARRNAWGIWNVGTETVKDMIYAALATDGDHPPEERRIRFPAGLPNEYFYGLLAEVSNPLTGRYEQRPGADYARNEPLDTLVYAIAIGHHRDVRIATARRKVARDNGTTQIVSVPDPAYWRRRAVLLEGQQGATAEPPPDETPPPLDGAAPEDAADHFHRMIRRRRQGRAHV